MSGLVNIYNRLYSVCMYHFFIMLLTAPFEIYMASGIAFITDKALEQDMKSVLRNAIILITLSVVFFVVQSLLNYLYLNKKLKITHLCKIDFYHLFLGQPVNLLYSNGSGDSLEKLNDDFNTIANKYIETFPRLFIGIIKFVIYFIIISYNSLLIGVTLLSISFIQLIPPVIIKKYMQNNYDKCRNIEAKITNYIIAGYEGFSTIKLFFLGGWYLDRLKNLHKKYKKIGNITELTTASEEILTVTTENILQYGTYIIIGIITVKTEIDYSVGVLAIVLAGSLFKSIKAIFATITEFAVIKTASKRLGNMQAVTENCHQPCSIKNDIIQYSDITCKFADKIIFNNITGFFHSKGTTIIVGENGCGKSSFVKIIAGIIKPDEGAVHIFGNNIRAINKSDLWNHIFYLDQWDINLSLTAYEVYQQNGEEVMQSCMNICKDFGLTEETIKKSKIIELSGGERKKVFLSLAFSKNDTFLILDEPTNYLDSESRKVLLKLLKTNKNDKVVITHDFELLSLADRILKIERGNIYEHPKESFL